MDAGRTVTDPLGRVTTFAYDGLNRAIYCHGQCALWVSVPGQILVILVAELTLYGILAPEGWFAEFWRTLENVGARGSMGAADSLQVITVGCSDGPSGLSGVPFRLLCRGRRRDRFLPALPRLVLREPVLQNGDGRHEVVSERDQQVDVVQVLPAGEAVGEVVPRIDGGPHLAAARADETEIAFADFGRRPLAAESGEGDRHRQIVVPAAHWTVTCSDV